MRGRAELFAECLCVVMTNCTSSHHVGHVNCVHTLDFPLLSLSEVLFVVHLVHLVLSVFSVVVLLLFAVNVFRGVFLFALLQVASW